MKNKNIENEGLKTEKIAYTLGGSLLEEDIKAVLEEKIKNKSKRKANRETENYPWNTSIEETYEVLHGKLRSNFCDSIEGLCNEQLYNDCRSDVFSKSTYEIPLLHTILIIKRGILFYYQDRPIHPSIYRENLMYYLKHCMCLYSGISDYMVPFNIFFLTYPELSGNEIFSRFRKEALICLDIWVNSQIEFEEKIKENKNER